MGADGLNKLLCCIVVLSSVRELLVSLSLVCCLLFLAVALFSARSYLSPHF